VVTDPRCASRARNATGEVPVHMDRPVAQPLPIGVRRRRGLEVGRKVTVGVLSAKQDNQHHDSRDEYCRGYRVLSCDFIICSTSVALPSQASPADHSADARPPCPPPLPPGVPAMPGCREPKRSSMSARTLWLGDLRSTPLLALVNGSQPKTGSRK